MQNSVAPKITNEEYIDLRNHINNIDFVGNQSRYTTPNLPNSRYERSKMSTEENLKNEKELIQSGLKKLVKTYNIAAEYTTNKNVLKKQKTTINQRPVRSLDYYSNRVASRSELVLDKLANQLKSPANSIKPIKSKKSCIAVNVNATGDKADSYLDQKLKSEANKRDNSKCIKIRSQDSLELDAMIRARNTNYPHSKINYRLRDDHNPLLSTSKPTPLKAQWRKHKTLPEIHRTRPDMPRDIDKNTYLYDDGSDIDSTYLEQRQNKYFSYAFESQFMNLLFFMGTVCGIFLVSLLVWIIFGNEFFSILLKPREPRETVIKKSIKFVGGGVVHILTRFFKTLGKLLAIPTQQIYQSQPEYYRWPAMLQR